MADISEIINSIKLGETFTLSKRITISTILDLLDTIDAEVRALTGDDNSSAIKAVDYFPSNFLKNTDIGLNYLSFDPAKEGNDTSIKFELSWENFNWEIIPEIITIDNFSVEVEVTGKLFFARLYTNLELEGYTLLTTVDFPTLLLNAKLLQTPLEDRPSPLALLKRFNAIPFQNEKELKDTRLTSFSIIANPKFKRFVLDLSIKQIPLGSHIRLNTQMQLGYTSGIMDGSLFGNFEIVFTPAKKILIVLSANTTDPNLGWELEGGVATKSIYLKDLLDYLSKKFLNESRAIYLGFDGDLSLNFVYVYYNTATQQFIFTTEFGLSKENESKVKLDFEFSKQAEDYTLKIGGELSIGKEADQRIFDLIFEKDTATIEPVDNASSSIDNNIEKKQTSRLIAEYRKPGGDTIGMATLIGGVLGADNVPAELNSFSFSLKSALLVIQTEKTANSKDSTSKYLFAVEVDYGIDLTSLGGLPIIGASFAGKDALRLDFQPIATKVSKKTQDGKEETSNSGEQFSKEDIAAISTLLPQGSLSLPADGLPSNITLMTTINWGDFSKTIDLGIPPKEVDTSLKDAATPKGSANEEETPKDHTEKLDKSFGGLSISRLNLKYDKIKGIVVQLDADLKVGPMELALLGLGASYNLKTKKLGATLDGMALTLKKPPLEISGAFLKIQLTEDSPPDYVGRIKIQTASFGLVALGAFSQIKTTKNGHAETMPSFWLYLAINYSMGGPVFFFVDGLALGFGYNRYLKIPDVSEIAEFPLVSEVMGTTTPPKLDGPIGADGENDASSLGEALRAEFETLANYIQPKKSQYFLAVGLKFNSFKIVHCFGLLVANFGETIDFALIGTGRVTYPLITLDDKEILAQIEIAIQAIYKPSEGFLGINATLTNNSFVLSKDCLLEGKLSFYSWMSGPHAGDFILTLGGYNKNFEVPDHYPQRSLMKRLGFNWKYSDLLSFKGGMYFAISPKAMMMGANLEGDFKEEMEFLDISATLKMEANILIYWKPFQYLGDASVEVTASVVIKALVMNFPADLSASAKLNFWGPPFAGVAHIKAKVLGFKVNFDVDIGEEEKPTAKKIDWVEFKKSFLPESPDKKAISISLSKGLINSVKAEGKEEKWIVNPKMLKIDVSSLVPFNDDEKVIIIDAVLGKSYKQLGFVARTYQSAARLKSSLKIEITDFKTGDNKIQSHFLIKTFNKKFPKSLWTDKESVGTQPEINGQQLIDLPGGQTITLLQPPTVFKALPIQVKNLANDVHEIELAEGQNKKVTYKEGEEWTADYFTKETYENKKSLMEELGIAAESMRYFNANAIADNFISQVVKEVTIEA